MTIQEFRSEFDLLYNNTLGEGAPGLDNYEISVYLTTAQEELIKDFYQGKTKGSFEYDEHTRRAVNELVRNYNTSSTLTTNRNLVDESKFFELPNDLMFIVNETVTLSSKTDSCVNNKIVNVKPITHDEFMVSYRNPFRKPNKNRVWRVDLSKENSLNTVELVSEYDISKYNVRYIKYPNPIIISDLTTDASIGGLGLTINGETAVSNCELNSYLHREILNRAVELSIRDFRENNLRSRIETNNRL